MLTIDSKLTNYMLAAGEPLVIDMQFQDPAANVVSLDGRGFSLTFYKSNREVIETITGEQFTDASGPFVRFQRDGTFSESLFGRNGIVVEIAERLRNGKCVLATGALKVAPSAAGIASLATAEIALNAVRVVFKQQAGGASFFTSVVAVPFVDFEGAQPSLPVFTAQPTISPMSGSVGETFTANDGAADNADNLSGRWLLDGVQIGTGATIVPVTAGTLVREVTATNAQGSVVATSPAATVTAVSIPAPIFTTQPSISPSGGNVGATFTSSDGTASNATDYARRWLLSGTAIGTGATVVPVTAGSLVLEVTATGPGGSTVATSAAVAVSGTGVVPTSPTESNTPTGDRTVTMTTRQTLPDGAFPLATGVGYPSTGACIDRTDNTYYGAHGTTTASTNAGFVHLSSTFQLLGQYTVGDMGLPGGSAQGIDIDRSDNTIWFILKATANGAYLVHCTRDGVLIDDILLSDSTWNGLAYDSRRDCLIMMKDNGAVSWIAKPATGATTVTSTGKTGFTAAGSNNDMLHYDPLRDELLISGGSNNTAGTVDVYDVDTTSAPTRIATLTLDQAQAIEGLVRVGNDLIVWNDQHTHPVSGQTTNQVQTYDDAMIVPATPPVFAFAANPVALEGETATFTLNVTRNGTTGALSGTYALTGITADAADFGGTFPSGNWTIADGATSTTISITSSEDALQEGDQTYTLTATYGGSTAATATGTIGEDDAPVGSYQPESEALFARMATQPDNTRKTAIDNLISSLKSGGVFAKADGLYIFAAHEDASARLNWVADARNVSPGTDGTQNPEFTVDRGYVTNGSNNYLDYGFSPATATLFAQNSASLAIWRNDSAASATGTASLGVSNSNQVGLNPRATSDVLAARLNSSTATVGGSSTDAKGLTAVSRSSSTAVQLYKNGVASGAAGSATSATKVTGSFRSGQVNGTDRIAGNFGAAFIGAGLTAGEQSTLYNAIATYMTAVGNV